VRITLSTERCTGHGRCYTLAPGLFQADEQGHCQLIVADLGPDTEAQARIAVGNCPEQALEIVD
jgi:ferredoxin